MKKRQNRKTKPLPADVCETLTLAINTLIAQFQEVSEKTPKMFWWSITVPRDDCANEDLMLYYWGDLLGADYKADLCNIAAIRGSKSGNWTRYAITGSDVTLKAWLKVSKICECAANALRYPGNPDIAMSLSDYLTGLNPLKSPSKDPAQVYFLSSTWFEFVYNTSCELGSMIVAYGGNKRITGWADARIPYRHIKQDICEASILALKFLQKNVNLASTKLNESQPAKGTKYWLMFVGKAIVGIGILLGILWTAIQIYESVTFKQFVVSRHKSQSVYDPNAQTESNDITLSSKTNHDTSNSLPDLNLPSPESPNQ